MHQAPAVLGVADHSGWAVCVTVAAAGGLPVVIDRRRVELIEPGLPTQPYHHETVGMPLPDAEDLAARVRDAVLRTAFAQVSALRDELRPSCTIVAMTMRRPPLAHVPVTVADAHASYPVTCRADAMMYHDALCTAARRLNIAVELHERGEEMAGAARGLGVSAAEVDRFLMDAGERLGPPWQKEHRLAAAAAIGVLAAGAPVAIRETR